MLLPRAQVVVCTTSSQQEALAVNAICAQRPGGAIPFIWARTAGLFGAIFCDFGDKFTVYDTDGGPCGGAGDGEAVPRLHAATPAARQLLGCCEQLLHCPRLQARSPTRASWRPSARAVRPWSPASMTNACSSRRAAGREQVPRQLLSS